MKYIKDNIKFFIFMVVMCIIGAYFATIYTMSSYDQKVIEEAINQIGSKELLVTITVVQTVIYAVILSGLGIIISNKVGLWKKFEKNKKAIMLTSIIAIVAGIMLSLGDRYIFGSMIDSVAHLYDTKPTIDYIITCFTYGGVFEEIMMRLFLMSLFVWIISKIFCKKKKEIPIIVFVISNVITALLFAAGHIPSTIQLFGYMDALLLIRCFLFNGLFGICFGYLYRKYGIGYSMLAHFGVHLINILLWLIVF